MEEAQLPCPQEEPDNNHPGTRAEKWGGGWQKECWHSQLGEATRKRDGRQRIGLGATEDSLAPGHDGGKDNDISCNREGEELTKMKQRQQWQGERVEGKGVHPISSMCVLTHEVLRMNQEGLVISQDGWIGFVVV